MPFSSVPIILQLRSEMSRFGFGFDVLRLRPGAWILFRVSDPAAWVGRDLVPRPRRLPEAVGRQRHVVPDHPELAAARVEPNVAARKRLDVRMPKSSEDSKTAADDFAQGADVGRHPVALLRSAVSHAEPRHDLVENQQDVVFVAKSAQALQIARVGGNDALQWLYNDSGDVVVFRQQCFKRREGWPRRFRRRSVYAPILSVRPRSEN